MLYNQVEKSAVAFILSPTWPPLPTGAAFKKRRKMATKNVFVKGLEYTAVAIIPMIAVYLGTVFGPLVGNFV